MPEDRGAWRLLAERGRRIAGHLAGPGPSAEVELLVASPLFDDRWYALLLGALGSSVEVPRSRPDAARHYLDVGRHRGLTPHPLFDPVRCATELALPGDDDRDALVAYLQEGRHDLEVHPLLDVADYVRDHPEALGHPSGPVGHYLEVGAGRGARPNSWYVPDPAREPRGLVDRLWREAEDWVGRRRLARTDVPVRTSTAIAEPPAAVPGGALVSVVLVAQHSGQDLGPAVDTVRAQDAPWELVVLGVGHRPRLAPEHAADERIRCVDEPQPDLWTARNHGLRIATGTHVTFLSVLEDWAPGRLRACVGAMTAAGADWAHDRARGAAGAPEFAGPFVRDRLRAGVMPPLGSVLVAREQALALGGFDEGLRAGHALDLLLRLADGADPAYVDRLGVTLQPRSARFGRRPPAQAPFVDWDRLVSAPDGALNRHLVDWSAMREEDSGDGTSVVIVADDGPSAALAVADVLAAGTCPDEVVVVDNDTGVVSAAVLGSLPERFGAVRVVRCTGRRGAGVAANLGIAASSSARIVLLDPRSRVEEGWLAPLEQALEADVLGAQPLVLDAAGTIHAAGVVFPHGGGLPHLLLHGFPAEDAGGAETDPLHAVSGAALAVRRADLAAVDGLDPLYRHGLEDVDLCLRLAQLRPGHFVLRPDSRVRLDEPARRHPDARPLLNRRLFRSRWAGRLPEDDVEAWRRRGLLVLGHRMTEDVEDRRLGVPEPILVRPATTLVAGVPRLRWALKNPAPAGSRGEQWGDTWFLRHLAEALRDLGQEVVIDHRPAWERPSEYLDDVVLQLRGRSTSTPLPGRVNLIWVISNPDMLSRSEVLGWDRVYVASPPFARMLAEQWGVPAVPLLQATDPRRFHPDLAEPDSGARVLLVGNWRPEPRALVRAAVEAGVPLTVFGSGWEEELPAGLLGGTFLPNDDLGAAYRAAGMVLNDHWQDMAAHGFLANRLFDSVAAGARVVSDDVPGIAEVFGEAVQVVRTTEDLARLEAAEDLDAVFGSDEVRRARAAHVAAEHSFARRARTLLEDAVRIRSDRGLTGGFSGDLSGDLSG